MVLICCASSVRSEGASTEQVGGTKRNWRFVG
jgi:hypothetical protein